MYNANVCKKLYPFVLTDLIQFYPKNTEKTLSVFNCVHLFLQYLGKTHNLWHRAVLMLEVMAFENGLSTQLIKTKPTVSEYEFEPTQSPQQVILMVPVKLIPFTLPRNWNMRNSI